jgi:hypothetical protein
MGSTEGEGRCPVVPLVFKNGDPLFNRSMETGVSDNSLFVLTFAGFHSLTHFSQVAEKRSFCCRIGK